MMAVYQRLPKVRVTYPGRQNQEDTKLILGRVVTDTVKFLAK